MKLMLQQIVIIWNDTAPTSSVFTVGTAMELIAMQQHILLIYLQKNKATQKFGSYTGNGNADGPFVYTGFKPALVMIKTMQVELILAMFG